MGCCGTRLAAVCNIHIQFTPQKFSFPLRYRLVKPFLFINFSQKGKVLNTYASLWENMVSLTDRTSGNNYSPYAFLFGNMVQIRRCRFHTHTPLEKCCYSYWNVFGLLTLLQSFAVGRITSFVLGKILQCRNAHANTHLPIWKPFSFVPCFHISRASLSLYKYGSLQKIKGLFEMQMHGLVTVMF